MFAELAGLADFDAAAGLRRVLGKEALYLSLLRRFVDSHAQGLAPLHALLRAGDRSGAERWVHSLRGVSASIGSTQLPALAQSVEDGLRAGAPAPDLGPRLQALDTPLQALLAGLRSALPTAAPPAMPPLAPVGEAPSLARLNLLLRDDDPEAACYLHDHEPALRTSLRERFHAVRAAVDAFDFDAALALTAPATAAGDY